MPAISSSMRVGEHDARQRARARPATRCGQRALVGGEARGEARRGRRRRPAGGARPRRARAGSRLARDLDARARSGRAAAGAARPPRGSSCPTSRKRAACDDAETPSRSTCTRPMRGGVEQHVDEVVGQQVDLVDVEDAAVRARPAGRAGTRRRPSRSARSRSSVPSTRSSVAPIGSSTSAHRAGARRRRRRCGPSGQSAPSARAGRR